MSTPLTETQVQHGRLVAKFFNPDGAAGDWHTFAVSFPTPFAGDDVRVVAMASNDGVNPGLGTVPVVPVVRSADRNGCVLAARNSDLASGSAGLHWIAWRESPGVKSIPPTDLRTIRVLPRSFAADGAPGDWTQWPVAYGQAMGHLPTVVCSAWRPPEAHADFIVQAPTFAFSGAVLSSGAVPVGVSQAADPAGLVLRARNAGGWPGVRAMHGVAVCAGLASDPSVMVDSGVVGPVYFTAAGGSVPQTFDIPFALPFGTPPVVLFCASDRGLSPGSSAIAAAGWVESVGTHGFRLQGLNTDAAAGVAAFDWVAIGCGPGCGTRTQPAPPGITIHRPIKISIPFDRLVIGLAFRPTVIDGRGVGWAAAPFSWSSSAPEVVSITADGEARARHKGKATLTAVARDPDLGKELRASIELVVDG